MRATLFRKSVCLLVGVLLLVIGCVTDYQPDTKTIPPSLIVDGLITDLPGPYTVTLHFTSDYTVASLNLLASGYTLLITENGGEAQPMVEISPGVYQTRNPNFRGQVGHTYQLRIVSPTGKKYESSLERINPTPPITRLYAQYHEQNRTGGIIGKDKGFNVFLDTKDPDTLGNYYRWRWTHYEFTTLCDFVGGIYIPCCDAPCWGITRCAGNKCIKVASDASINGKALSGQFIMQAPYESTSTYYLEVEQLSLSAGAYQYWHQVDQQVNQSGGIFDAAPASIRGNIVCTSHPDELAFGYFGVSSSTVSALVIDRSLAPSEPNVVLYPSVAGYCTPCNETPYHTPMKPRFWPK